MSRRKKVGPTTVLVSKSLPKEAISVIYPYMQKIHKQNDPFRYFKKCLDKATECANCVSQLKWFGTEKPKHNFKRCSACQLVSYCSRKCQKEHWLKGHNRMCSKLCWEQKPHFVINNPIEGTCQCKFCSRFEDLKTEAQCTGLRNCQSGSGKI